MEKGNGSRLGVESGSEKFSKCPLVDTAGEKLPLKHLLKEVYDKKNVVCQECGVCKAFSMKVAEPAPKGVPTADSRKKVRPHGWNATHKRTIRRVSSGLGG